MIVRCTICVALCATLLAEVGSAQIPRSRTQMQSRTQTQRPRTQTQQRPTTSRAGAVGRAQPGIRGATGRSAAPQGRVRQVSGTAPKAPPVDPVLDRLLKEWEVASSKIHKIQGEHLRRVYDMVFKVEKVSTGVFYHEVPDKGRIDIEPFKKIREGAKSDKIDPVTKKPFDLVGGPQREMDLRWQAYCRDQ